MASPSPCVTFLHRSFFLSVAASQGLATCHTVGRSGSCTWTVIVGCGIMKHVMKSSCVGKVTSSVPSFLVARAISAASTCVAFARMIDAFSALYFVPANQTEHRTVSRCPQI